MQNDLNAIKIVIDALRNSATSLKSYLYRINKSKSGAESSLFVLELKPETLNGYIADLTEPYLNLEDEYEGVDGCIGNVGGNRLQWLNIKDPLMKTVWESIVNSKRYAEKEWLSNLGKSKNDPKGLLLAALSNMGERFGYYIMNAVLALFLCSKFGLSDGQSGFVAAMFLTAIYVLSLVGGIIADRTQNYKATIAWGLVVMALGYVLLAIPILATPDNISWLLPFTVFALALIACGNGLFKGNLQAIVGQMYDNFEAAAAKESPDRLKWAQGQRDAGFQIFYVFINVGALLAPFIAPLLRSWWLKVHGLTYLVYGIGAKGPGIKP